MEYFSYKDGCGVRGHHTHIEAFNRRATEELAWATDQ